MSDPVPESTTNPRYVQVVFPVAGGNAQLYQLLVDCICSPETAATVRSIVFLDPRATSPRIFSDRPPFASRLADEQQAEHGKALFKQALEPLELGDEEARWLEALTWTPARNGETGGKEVEVKPGRLGGVPSSHKQTRHGKFGSYAPLLLLTLCANIENFVCHVGIDSRLSDFLHRNNYGRLPLRYLQNLKHITLLPGDLQLGLESYALTDPLAFALSFHRLPRLETFSARTLMENHRLDYKETAVPNTSNLKSLNITNSYMKSSVLAAFIRMPRALENFKYDNGGDWTGPLGGGGRFFPRTIAKALWTQRDSLKEIDINCESRVLGGFTEQEDVITSREEDSDEEEAPDPEQDPDTIADREIELGVPGPLCPSKLPGAREYGGTLGSLHEFTALERLSIGVGLLLGRPTVRKISLEPGEEQAASSTDGSPFHKTYTGPIGDTHPENTYEWFYRPSFRLVDALPPSLQYLKIRGYEKGLFLHWDEQIADLMSQKAVKLPNLRIVEGVTERIATDVDLGRLKPHDRNQPKRALTSYFVFMQDVKPLIRLEHPDWSSGQISEESEKRWVALTPEERSSMDYKYKVDRVRYFMQRKEYDEGRPVPEISFEEAEDFYKRYQPIERQVEEQAGREGLGFAVRLWKGGELSVENITDAVRAKKRKDEEERERVEGPNYEWIEEGDETDLKEWVEVEHPELTRDGASGQEERDIKHEL